MATKTFKQLVNDVLIRLREDQVSSVVETPYSTLVGAWINDAKRMVEDGWDWQALQAPVQISIVASTQTYALSTLNERARLLRDVQCPKFPLAYDTTVGDPFQLVDAPLDWIRTQRTLLATNPSMQAKPMYFATSKTSGGVQVDLYEMPTASRTWTLYFVDPQDDLSADSDFLVVPYAPVIQIALDYALSERGEEIGEPGTTVEQKALIHIGNAVAIDAQEQPHKTTFYPG